MFGRRKKPERTGIPVDLLVVGLGNPGEKYDGTRHNVGAEVVEVLAERASEALKPSKQAALSAELRFGEKRIAVAFPQTFMNHSGLSVRDLKRRYGVEDAEKMLIIHDELPIIGTQFHPEYYTDEHPAGRQLIENFFRVAGIIN